MATVDELKIVISAEDNASGVIGAVASSINTLGNSQSKVLRSMVNLDNAIKTNGQQILILGNAADQTKKKLDELNKSKDKGKNIIFEDVKTKAEIINAAGNVVEGISKIRGAMKAGSALAKAKLYLASIGCIGVATRSAVLIGRALHDAYVHSKEIGTSLNSAGESLSKHLEDWRGINDISQELKGLELVIGSEDSSEEDINAAQQRIEEIRQLLSEEYSLDISCDTSEIEKAIDLLKESDYRDTKRQIGGLLMGLEDEAEEYEKQIQYIKSIDDDLNAARDNVSGGMQKYYQAKAEGDKKAADEYFKNAQAWQKRVDDLENDGWYQKYKEETRAYQENAKKAVEGSFANAQYELLKGYDASQSILDLQKAMEYAGVSGYEYARGLAAAKTGYTELSDVMANGRAAEMEHAFIEYSKNFGVSSEQTQTGLKSLSDKFTELGRAAGKLNGNEQYSIDIDGNISVINKLEEAQKAIDRLRANGSIKLDIDTNGDVRVLETADETLKKLAKNGEVKIKFNIDTGGFDITDLGGDTIGEITAKGTVNWKTGEAPDTVPDAEGKANYEVGESPDSVPDASGNANYSMGDHPTTAPTIYGEAVYTVKMVTGSSPGFTGKNAPWANQSRGTQYFPGGLAMVNDQRGIGDPRELIVDRGRAFIPSGRDVILPLSKGARVYTAAQTKAIMNRLGIPRYASGKDNSDGFISARDDWNHYTKTHAVTTTEELQKWVELSKQFKDNQKDVWDIEEQIFSLQQKITKELNDQSLSYIAERAALNDWDEYGDSAIDAFGRIRDRNREALDQGRITWDEYSENVKKAGEALYDGRAAQSRKWLSHEEKYNDMSLDEHMAHLQDMAAYTREMYDEGIIDKKKFIEESTKIDEEHLDKYKENQDKIHEKFLKGLDLSQAYVDERTALNDWDDYFDSPFAAYQRVNDKWWDEIQSGRATYEEADAALLDFGTSLFEGKVEQSKAWLDEQRKYFDMSDEDYAAGLYRIKKYTQEFLNQGMITRTKYNEIMTEMNHALWDEAGNAYDVMLKNQSDYISDLREKFSKEEQALRDSWDIEDRQSDISDIQKQLKIYQGAVTEQGQEKYKELQKQLVSLQRDEELYNLQVRNNDTIEKLQADYEKLEGQKSAYLKGIAENTDVDIGAVIGAVEKGTVNDISKNLGVNVDRIVGNMENMGNLVLNRIAGLISDVIRAVETKEVVTVGPMMSDNRNISINTSRYMDFAPFLAGLRK